MRGENTDIVKKKAGELVVRIAGIWGIKAESEEVEEEEAGDADGADGADGADDAEEDDDEDDINEIMKEQLREYYEAAKAYAEAALNLQVLKIIEEQRNGNGSNLASMEELESQKSKAKAALDDITGARGMLESFNGNEEIKIKLKMMYDALETAKEEELGLIERAIKILWGEMENLYADEIKKREKTIGYLTGGVLETLPMEEERRKKELESYLAGQLAGLEAEKEAVSEEVNAGHEDLIDKIGEAMDEIAGESGWETVQGIVNGYRSDWDFDAMIRGGSVLSTAAGETIAWAEWRAARRDSGLAGWEMEEEIKRDYGVIEARAVNAANAAARAEVRKIIEENKSGLTGGIGYERAAELIRELRSAGEGLNETGREALENYIEGLLELAAAKDVYGMGKEVSDEENERLKEEYKNSEKLYKEYSQWQYKLYDINDYYRIFASGEYGRLGEEEKEALRVYAADWAAEHISMGDIGEWSAEGVISAVRKLNEEIAGVDGG